MLPRARRPQDLGIDLNMEPLVSGQVPQLGRGCSERISP